MTIDMASVTVADLLDESARVMEVRGKAIGRYEDSEGRVCAFGAMNLAFTGDSSPVLIVGGNVFYPAQDYLLEYIYGMMNVDHSTDLNISLAAISDADVVNIPEAMRLAAKQWRQDNEQ